VAFVMQTLAEIRNPADVVVEEAPSARPVMQEYLPFTRSGTFLTMESGGLGYGMPAAVGVALAKPGTHVIALIGDGSSMYSIQAIWSAVQLNLPITFVILNNSRYAALQDFAPVFGFAPTDPVQGTDLPGLDFVTLAAGMGCRGVAVKDASQLRGVLNDALQTVGPMLIEAVVA
jgi:benzoylformate decarboxylase